MEDGVELTRDEAFDILEGIDLAFNAVRRAHDLDAELALETAHRVLAPKLNPDLPAE